MGTSGLAAPPNVRPRVVDAGDVVVSAEESELLATDPPIGSSVAVTLWDPDRKVAGLLHFVWPTAVDGEAAAPIGPAACADTGIRLLLDRVGHGAPPRASWKVRLVGGATVSDREAPHKWAKRNVLAARRMLWQCGVLLDGEDVGGDRRRVATLRVADGQLSVIRQDLPAEGAAGSPPSTQPR